MVDEYIILKNAKQDFVGDGTIRGVRAPYQVNAGTYTRNAEIEVPSPAYDTDDTAYSIPLSTSGQTLLKYSNYRYRKLALFVDLTANDTSTDLRLACSPIGGASAGVLRGDTGTQTWIKDTITGTGTYVLIGDIPVGLDIWFIGDNNDGAAAATGTLYPRFYDPIR